MPVLETTLDILAVTGEILKVEIHITNILYFNTVSS